LLWSPAQLLWILALVLLTAEAFSKSVTDWAD